MADGVTYAGALAACVALAAIVRAVVLRWRRLRAERAWQETCARYPWRVAAVYDGGPLMLFLDDDLLRAWWHDAGEPRPRMRSTKEPTPTKGP